MLIPDRLSSDRETLIRFINQQRTCLQEEMIHRCSNRMVSMFLVLAILLYQVITFYNKITFYIKIIFSTSLWRNHFNNIFITLYLHRLSIFSINCTENGECVMTAWNQSLCKSAQRHLSRSAKRVWSCRYQWLDVVPCVHFKRKCHVDL